MLDASVGDQSSLLSLSGLQLGKLAKTGHQRLQVVVLGRPRRLRDDAFDLGEVGDHSGVDAIGFFQQTESFGKATNRARVQDGNLESSRCQLQEDGFLVAAGGFHGDQFNTMQLAKGGQFGDALRGGGKAARRSFETDAGL